MKNNIIFITLFACTFASLTHTMLKPLGDNYQKLFDDALMLVKQQQYNLAARNLEWITLKDPNAVRKLQAHCAAGKCYQELNQLLMAQFHFNCAFNQKIDKASKSYSALGLGMQAIKQNNLPKAAKFFSKAAEYAVTTQERKKAQEFYFNVIKILHRNIDFDNTDQEDPKIIKNIKR